jgi:hypothetical protein
MIDLVMIYKLLESLDEFVPKSDLVKKKEIETAKKELEKERQRQIGRSGYGY